MSAAGSNPRNSPELIEVRAKLRESLLKEIGDEVDPISFAKSCGFYPDPYQTDALMARERRRIFLWGRRCGKTATCAIMALWTAMFRKDASVIIISPTLNQSREMLNEVRSWFDRYSAAHPKSKYITTKRVRSDEMEFAYGGRILCRPATSASIKGYGADLLIVDEAARVPDQLLNQDITPFLATTGGSIILISTPYAVGGAFHKAWTLSQQEQPLWKLYGPVKSEQCSRVDKAFLAEEREWMPSDYYRQEYEAQWISALSNVFDKNQVDAAFMPSLGSFKSGVVVGVDLAKINDFTVFVALNKEGELTAMEEYQKLPYPDVVERLKVFTERNRAERVLVDQTGVGEAVLDDIMRSKLKGMANGMVLSMQKKTDLINNLRNAFEKKKIHIPGIQVHHLARKLYAQLLMYRYEELPGSGMLRTTAPEGEHDDYVIALALAAYQLRPGGRIALLHGMDSY
jgi:phage terminase large subunit-like protein